MRGENTNGVRVGAATRSVAVLVALAAAGTLLAAEGVLLSMTRPGCRGEDGGACLARLDQTEQVYRGGTDAVAVRASVRRDGKPVAGLSPKDFVVLDNGATLEPKQIARASQSRLENFMVPKYVEIVEDLPKTDTGKIKKTGLE